MWLAIASVAFWFIKIDFVDAVFMGAFRAGQYPISIYPEWLRVGLSTIVPIGLALTAPASALTSRLSLAMLLGAIAVAIVSSLISGWVLRRGLAAYSSASS